MASGSVLSVVSSGVAGVVKVQPESFRDRSAAARSTAGGGVVAETSRPTATRPAMATGASRPTGRSTPAMDNRPVRRMGSSMRWNEAMARARTTAMRTVNSGQPSRPVRCGLIHRNNGQWNR